MLIAVYDLKAVKEGVKLKNEKQINVLRTPLEKIVWPRQNVRIRNALTLRRFKRTDPLWKLVELKPEQVGTITDIGTTCVNCIITFLAEYSLWLGMKIDEDIKESETPD